MMPVLLVINTIHLKIINWKNKGYLLISKHQINSKIS